MSSRHARWVFLPVAGAPIAHAPVLRLDLLRSLARPIDGGGTFRGRRVLGDNKTWRGALCMGGGVFALGVALHRRPWYRERLPRKLQSAPAAAFAGALAVGTVAGEFPNSFLKRQIGIAPGAQRGSAAGVALSVLDQGDLVLGIWAAMTPLWRMPARAVLDAFAWVSAIHLVLNVAGYAIGARERPI